jgi:DNA-binding NarL/FixJ family response regulator
MRILVYSAIRLFGEGLAACLTDDASVSAAACCCPPEDIVSGAERFAADVVLIDVTNEAGLRDGRALSAACPALPIIALALAEASSDIIACADAGFASYVPRDAPISQLREIIAMAMRGEVACHPKVSGALLRELRIRRARAHETAANEPLTRRECEVLRLLGRGLSNKELARRLMISESTIKNHVHRILAKLKVSRRTEALARVRDEPWIASIG